MYACSFLRSFVWISLFTACTKTKELLVQPEPDPPVANDYFTRFWFKPANNAAYLIDSANLEIKDYTILHKSPIILRLSASGLLLRVNYTQSLRCQP